MLKSTLIKGAFNYAKILKGNDIMVKVVKMLNCKTKISSEENNAQTCRKCIDDILTLLSDNGITVETAFAILDECKNEIRSAYEQKAFKTRS